MQALLPPKVFSVLYLKITTFKKLPMIRPKRKKINVMIGIIIIHIISYSAKTKTTQGMVFVLTQRIQNYGQTTASAGKRVVSLAAPAESTQK